MILLEGIILLTNEYANLSSDVKGNSVIISSGNYSTPLVIKLWQKENTLELGEWHWHFENGNEDEELLSAITSILSNKSVLREHYLDGQLTGAELLLNDEVGRPLKTSKLTLPFRNKEKTTQTKPLIFS